jgi:hypothetical protein
MPKLSDSDRIEKKYYSVGDVCRLLDISDSGLRLLEEESFITIPRKHKARYYTKLEIEKLKWVIKAGKVYKYVIIRTAVHLFTEDRLLNPALLSAEEIETIYKYLKYDNTGKISTAR